MQMITSGGPIRPSNATAAPAAPPNRVPNTTEKLIMLAPGRNCENENVSLNSSAVIHRRRSTMSRRDHGNAPPNATTETPANASKSSSSPGGLTGGADIAAVNSENRGV